MPYIAIHDGEKKGAFEVPYQTDAYCIDCGERVRVWREAADGTARHFKHVSAMQGGGEGGGGGDGCSAGESDEHRKWKNFAAERLSEVFANAAEVAVEKPLAAPHTGKERRYADAAVMFEDYDQQLGNGLAVEVQHKNVSKDVAATTRDYLKQDVAVAWLDESDFSDSGCRLNQLDFRNRASELPSPQYFLTDPPSIGPDVDVHASNWLLQVRHAREELNRPEVDHELSEREWHVPAQLPGEFFDELAEDIYRDQKWESLFKAPSTLAYRTEAAIPRANTTSQTAVTLPPEFVDTVAQRVYRAQEWGSLFTRPTGDVHRLRASIPDAPTTQQTTVTLPPELTDTVASDLKSETPWAELFTPPETAAYIREVRQSRAGSDCTAEVDFSDWIVAADTSNPMRRRVMRSYYVARSGSNATAGKIRGRLNPERVDSLAAAHSPEPLQQHNVVWRHDGELVCIDCNTWATGPVILSVDCEGGV